MIDNTTTPAPAKPGVIPREVKGTLSGLDQLRAIRDGKLGVAPMQALMNMRLVEVEEGRVVFAGTPDERHYNPGGIVHGAFTAAMLDSAMGLALASTLPAGVGHTTIEFKLNMVRPMFAHTGEVRGEGRLLHRGRTIATAEGSMVDAAGKLIAHGTTTLMILAG